MEWKTMSSAPRDGTDILVYYEYATVPIIHIAYWDEDEHDMWEMEKFQSKAAKIGWWAYVENSVSQWKLEDEREPIFWTEYERPTKQQRYVAYGMHP